MGEPTLAVGGIVTDRGRILLVRRATPPDAGRWSVPGGRVEPGETLHEAVVREVREETGIDVVAGELLGWVERLPSSENEGPEANTTHFVILDFAARPLEPATQPVPGGDASEAAWVPFEELPSTDLVEGLEPVLRDVGVMDAVRRFDL